MKHPSAAELLELHFGEAGPLRGPRLAAHVRGCADCGRLLQDVAWAESLLAAVPDAPPPADGLERVLARVARVPAAPAPAAAARPWRAAAPAAAAVAAGLLVGVLGGATAVLVFLGAGSLVTLSLAPALILESQRRGGAAAAR